MKAPVNSNMTKESDRSNSSAPIERPDDGSYRNLVDRAVVGMYRSTLAGRFLYANPAMARMLGYSTPEELISTVPAASALRAGSTNSLRSTSVSGPTVPGFECELYRKDGSRIWCAIHCQAVEGKEGEPVCYEGTLVDISEWKTGRAAKDRAETKYPELIENVMLLELDMSALGDWMSELRAGGISYLGDYLRATPGATQRARDLIRIKAANRENLSAFNIGGVKPFTDGLDLGIPSTREAFIGHLYSLWRGETEHEFEIITTIPGAKQLVLLVRAAVPVIEGRPDLSGVLYTAVDITGLKETEREAQMLAEIVDQSDDAIVRTDLEGKVTAWTRGAERCYGYSTEEILGRPASILVPPERASDVDKIRDAVLQGKTVHFSDTVRVAKDGRRIDVSTSVFPIRDESGSVVGAGAVSRDISEYKRLQQQFQWAQRMELTSRLAGAVAHDLNNILMVVTGHGSTLLEELAPDSRSIRRVEAIIGSAKTAAGLLDQLLAFGGQRIRPVQAVALDELIREMTEDLRGLVGPEIDLEMHLAALEDTVEANPAQIGQVILNLATNARDAMPSGGKLVVRTESIELERARTHLGRTIQRGKYVLLTVRDDGVGMVSRTLSQIFEPFFSTKEKDVGTGLGLAVVHGVVQQSGGLIEAESREGEGTTIRIYLPRSSRLVQPPEPMAESARPTPGRKTVLVVDDNDQVRKVAAEILRAGGYDVLEASGSLGALGVVERGDTIDLVLTDVVMPDMRGTDLATRIGELRPGIGVLFMSGYPDQAGKIVPGGQLVEKPFVADELLDRVAAALGRRNPENEDQASGAGGNG